MGFEILKFKNMYYCLKIVLVGKERVMDVLFIVYKYRE